MINKKLLSAVLCISFVFSECSVVSQNNISSPEFIEESLGQDSNGAGSVENSSSFIDDNKENEEGGDNTLVFCEYEFNDVDSFLYFYNSYKLNNPKRFLFPESDEGDIKVKYIFTAEGVNVNDYHNLNYEILYPYANLKIVFLIENRASPFINQSFYAEYNSVDITLIADAKSIDISYSLHEKKIIIKAGKQILTTFQYTSLNYQKADIEVIIEKIINLLKRGIKYAF